MEIILIHAGILLKLYMLNSYASYAIAIKELSLYTTMIDFYHNHDFSP